MAIINAQKPRRAMPIPEGVEVSEEVSVQKAPEKQIDSKGNLGVITDFIIRDLSGPKKKKFIEGASKSQDVPPYLGEFISNLAMDELESAKKVNNTASPDGLAEILSQANNFGFNLLSSEQDKKGNPVYTPQDPQHDQTKALSIGLNSLIKNGFIPPSDALKWTRDAFSNPQGKQAQPEAKMGQLQMQKTPEQVDFSVSESILPEDLPPMEGF
tara:strand:+ start:339 stop:977 length:639 start_codon:yes stop_codon:yes gene_type:complete